MKTLKDSDIRKKEELIKFELMELDKKQRLILPKIKKNKLLKNYPNKSVKEINLLFSNLNKDLVDEIGREEFGRFKWKKLSSIQIQKQVWHR